MLILESLQITKFVQVHGTRVTLAVGHYWSFVMFAAIWVVDKYRIFSKKLLLGYCYT